MAKQPSLEEKLARLNALDLAGPAAESELRAALQDKSAIVVTKAAQLVGKARMETLVELLEQSFPRFMSKPLSTDKGCRAKQAIANSLYEMGIRAEEVFLAGIHHVQLEPALGGPVDTAAELRGICALGLVRMAYRDTLTELADLLGDPERQTRIMAARALAYSQREDGAPLLRLKILAGDREPDVLAECFSALLQLTPRKALPLIARFLDSPDTDLALEAALAIGSTRSAEAFELLKSRWEGDINPAKRQPLLTPLAMLRRPEAIDMLLSIVENAAPQTALAALEALAIYRTDDAIRPRILAAANARDEDQIRRTAARAFGA